MNWTGNLSRYFINNGKLTFLMLITFSLWGYMSFLATPKKYNPTIVAPAFQVSVDVPGASQNEILEQVTKPLENVIGDLEGVEDIYSMTFHGGRAVLNVNFYVGEDLTSSKVALSDRLKTDEGLAPLGINTPQIKSVDPEEVAVLTILMKSDKLDPIELRKKAWQLRDQLSQIEGTSRISVFGGLQRELRVNVHPKKLKEYGISLQLIEDALKMNNVFLPSGTLKGDKSYQAIEANGWVKSPEEIKNIVIVTNDTVDVFLKDIATVEEAPVERTAYTRHLEKDKDGQVSELNDAVLLSVSKLKGVNISDVTESVGDYLKNNKTAFSNEGYEAEVIVDKGQTAKEEINGLLINLAQSIIIVILVLFFFLNLKAAALVAIAIPLTLATVFGFAFLFDQTINRITLFALILSLGMLVDNATVVIENIVRKVGSVKEPKKEDFADAVNEVGPGLFMSTVTTVLAFIPMAFISGMMGPYMGPIPFFIPVALIMALFISYSINPWMASVLIKKSSENDMAHEKPGTLKRAGMKFLHSYRESIKNLLSHDKKRLSFISITVVLLLIAMSFPFIEALKFRMLPKADVDQFFLYVDLPDNAPLSETYSVSKALENRLLEDTNVLMVQSYVGKPPIIDFNGLFKGVSGRQLPNQATLRVGLLSDEKREMTSEEIVLNLRSKLNEVVAVKNSNAILKLVEDPPGPPVLSTMLMRFQGDKGVDIEKEARAFLPFFSEISEVVDRDISSADDTEVIELLVDHQEASRVRIPPAQIIQTLRTIYSGKVISVYHNPENIEQELVVLRVPLSDRDEMKELEDISLRNPLRITVPLSRLAKVVKSPAKKTIMRENHRNTVYLTAEMGARSVTYAGIDILSKIVSYSLSDNKGTVESWDLYGVHYKTPEGKNVYINIGGEWELTLEVFRDLMLAMAVALLVIYIVLVAQFNSFAEPLIIMSTIPLSLLGVMPGFAILFALKGEYFTATSMIGVIALAGIAVNNSIILLEYLNSLKIKEMDIVDALVEAGATRLRPIALTTVTTMLGSMTILSDPVWSGLAWSIILGLGMSSTLILYVFPVLYYTFVRKQWPNFHSKKN